MDFQRLFKRKAGDAAPSVGGDRTRENLNEREVLVRKGELLDGPIPASLLWDSVGGAVRVKADKIAGILEGRTRIKAEVLQELHPHLFESAPNPGTEYHIPLQAIINQLEDLFAGTAPEEFVVEDFETPFGQLAREDEARFKNPSPIQPVERNIAAPIRPPDSKPMGDEQDQNVDQSTLIQETKPDQKEGDAFINQKPDAHGLNSIPKEMIHRDLSSLPRRFDKETESSQAVASFAASGPTECRTERGYLEPEGAELSPAPELRTVVTETPVSTYGDQSPWPKSPRRAGLEYLQELYLTDDLLDASKVADLILRLPRVSGVVIMLSDGAALGGGLGGGINEKLLSLAPEFIQQLRLFSKSMPGGPAKFSTFWCHDHPISLAMDGNVLILIGHQGRNLPPGLRERLVATAQGLSMIYDS